MPSRGASMNMFTCRYYVEAMKFGSKYIYQTMPRLLTIWADMAQLGYIVAIEREKNKPPP
jgi:serine/threonine-protein kinase ATR